MRLKSIVACLAAAPLLLAASEPLRLRPASNWVLDYGENSCRLIRTFGDPAKPTVLLFERASPTSGLSMVAIGDTLKPSIRKETVSARFLPGDNLKFEDGLPAKSKAHKDPAVLWSRVDFLPIIELKGPVPQKLKKAMLAAQSGERPAPIDLAKRTSEEAERDAQTAKVTAVEIIARNNRPVILETGSLGRPIKMLSECTRHQLKGWGVNPEIEAKIVRPAWAPGPQRWFTADDFPLAMLIRIRSRWSKRACWSMPAARSPNAPA
ncbi:MAG: hypothetical protein LH465_04050 [Sphingomonas bacterium]|nr:hypothetical protein [Sphingomonas bacterium]